MSDTGHNASITSLEFSSGDTLVAANNEGRIFVTMWKAPKISDSLTLPGNSNTPAYLFLNRAKDTAVVYSQKMVKAQSNLHSLFFLLKPCVYLFRSAY